MTDKILTGVSRNFSRTHGSQLRLAAIAMLCLAFIFGGSSRHDVMPLLILRPLSIIALVASLWTLRWKHFEKNRWLLTSGLMIIIYLAISLVPLPPSMWQGLPGRDLVIELDRIIGNEGVWRPFSLTPIYTWNALFSLALPLAALVVLSQMDPRQVADLVPAIAAILFFTVLLGYLQALGFPLNLYDLGNENAGLFANRNHQALAISILVPVMATIATSQTDSEPKRDVVLLRRRKIMFAIGGVLFVVPLIFITGSRAGLVHAGIGILTGLAIVWKSSLRQVTAARSHSRVLLPAITLGTLAMLAGAGWALFDSDRNTAVSRLFAKDIGTDMRFSIWETSWTTLLSFWPAGSGVGSFVEVFQIFEPADQLQPNYTNHAHNDYLELALTAGVPGLVLMLACLIGFLCAIWQMLKGSAYCMETLRYRYLGLSIIFLCGLASLVDYPLRTPALSTLLIFAIFLAKTRDVAGSAGGDTNV